MSYSLSCPADAIRLLVEYFLDERMEAEGPGHMLATPYIELTCGHAQGWLGTLQSIYWALLTEIQIGLPRKYRQRSLSWP